MTPERLSFLRAHADRGGHFTRVMVLDLLGEIDKLQAEFDCAVTTAKRNLDQRDALRAEVERLQRQAGGIIGPEVDS